MRAFTLIEVLIVVVILGILAAIVVPQFDTAAEQSRESTMRMSLQRVRQQIAIYTQQHQSQPPSLAAFEAQMTQASNAAGQTAAPGTDGYTLGPYIRELPVNPFTSGRQISGTRIGADGSGASDWYYDASTGRFAANHDPAHADW